MPLSPLSGGGNLHFRPTAGNNFGGRQGLTSINNPAGKSMTSINDMRKSGVTSAAHLTQTSHVYATGDSTSLYKPGETFGSKGSVSVNQMINKKQDMPGGSGAKPGMPAKPILPPL